MRNNNQKAKYSWCATYRGARGDDAAEPDVVQGQLVAAPAELLQRQRAVHLLQRLHHPVRAKHNVRVVRVEFATNATSDSDRDAHRAYAKMEEQITEHSAHS